MGSRSREPEAVGWHVVFEETQEHTWRRRQEGAGAASKQGPSH